MSFGKTFGGAALAWLVLGSVAGCGGTDGGGAAPVSIEQFPAKFADAWCDNVGSCCRAGNWSFDLASCKQYAAASLGTALIAVAVNNPNAEYDAQAAGTCLQSIASAARGCDAEVAEPVVEGACDAVVIGKLAQGATCKSDQECAHTAGQRVLCSGLIYDDGITSGSGVCAPPAAAPVHGKAGEQCVDTCVGEGSCFVSDSTRPNALPCYTSDGLYCSTTDVVCEPLIELGKPCSTNGCASGAFCDSGVCAAQRDTGPCEEGGDTCSANSFCNAGQCEPKRADGSPMQRR